MKRLLMFAIFLGLVNSGALAAPDPPLEYILVRAKNVLIVDALSQDQTKVSLQVVADLRGKVSGKLSFTLEEYLILKKGSQWLLISQGDNRHGEPGQVLDRPMEGQNNWCGWMPLPILKVGDKTYVGGIFSSCDGDPIFDFETPSLGRSLELSRVKRLVQRFPYNPDVNK